ncbi:MAG: C1 family peptidase, partial [Atopobiaceae bacterium]|nr:C1 family peptidase [Atopobiaceae bacterium]
TYGVSLKTASTVTNQRQSGRCWMFATLNVARAAAMRRLDVEDLEFSQAYGMFYDKLEKANSFLANVIDTAGLPADDRTVSLIMDEPAPDGGLFRFAANLIAKWGLVPKDVMPETACSRNSREMNLQLDRLLRRDAADLRSKAADGASTDELDAARRSMMGDVHRMLCICLGEPPVTFDLECAVGPHADVPEGLVTDILPAPDADDKDAKPRHVLRDAGITPRQYRERYVGFDPDDYVVLVSVPGQDRPFGHAFGIRYEDTVVGGAPLRMLNQPMDVLEGAAVASLEAGVPCYMACDVGKNLGRSLEDYPGTLALDGMDLEGLFGVPLDMEKATMYDLHESCMTHAMTFQGVELASDGRPHAWRVENSWGKDSCKDGYLVMAADWYRLYGGGVVVERRFVPDDVLEAWDKAPLELQDPWSVLALAMGLRS